MANRALRPSDVAVLLELGVQPEPATVPAAPSYRGIAVLVQLSVGEVHNAVKRLRLARLIRSASFDVAVNSAMEFLLHGVRFAFPAELGPVTRGVPTGPSAPVIAASFAGDEQPVVWPSASGNVRGASVTPLLASAPDLPELNPKLYESLALVDALRVGRARERKIAGDLLGARIHAHDAGSARPLRAVAGH
jgi:hypothetical protein